MVQDLFRHGHGYWPKSQYKYFKTKDYVPRSFRAWAWLYTRLYITKPGVWNFVLYFFQFFLEKHPKYSNLINSDDCIGKSTSKSIYTNNFLHLVKNSWTCFCLISNIPYVRFILQAHHSSLLQYESKIFTNYNLTCMSDQYCYI